MPKVSIIIPFNNVENYITECLDSVLNQTLSDIELILINDASTDSSREIVQKYAEKDSRIKIIDIEERKGQGFARNRGIEAAQGEYIGFVDSDDFVENDMFELLYNSAKTNNTDISMCQVREYDDINENYITSDYYSLDYLNNFGESIFSAEDTKEQILDINVALWNKVYKREYLLSIGEKFPEGFIYEDLPFFFGTYLPAKRIQIVWKNLYSYRVNRKNSTMQQFNNKILDRLPMVSLTYEKLKNTPFLSDLKQKIQAWIINDLFHRYSLLKESYHKEFFFLMKKVFESLEIENVEDDYWKRVYHFQGYLLVMNNSFEDFNQKVFNEYLDIHKVEDRLRSEMLNNDEIDRRFNLIYSDLSNTYKYSEEIVNNLEIKTETSINSKLEEVWKEVDCVKNAETSINSKIDEIKNDLNDNKSEICENISNNINKVTSETDEKISKVYDEISNNYKYTEELINASEKQTDSKINNINQEIDNKCSEIYNEITKNYKYTETLVDSSKQQAVEQISELSNKTNEKIDSLNKNINDLAISSKELVQTSINSIEEKISSEINKLNDEISGTNRNLIEKIETETANTLKKINEDKTNLIAHISQQTIEITSETDNKLSKVYDEITHNYKYTEELVNTANNRIEELKPQIDDVNKKIDKNKNEIQNNINSQIEQVTNSTDSKISHVYEEITRNYDYTNRLSSDLKNEVNSVNSSVKGDIENLRNNINEQLYEKYKNLYTDIKDLSFLQNDNYVELNKEQNLLKQQNAQILQELADTQKKHEAQVNAYKQNLISKMKDFEGLLKHTSVEINKFIDELQIKIETENKNTSSIIEEMKAEFDEKLKLQEQKHYEELKNMHNQMLKMRYELREEMKSPIKKLIEKYKNKQEQ